MRRQQSLIAILLVSIIGLWSYNFKNTPPMKKKMLRHVVMFKFKDGTTPEQIKSVEVAFAKLPTQIKEIKGFEWGINNSPEGHSQGFTHCFFVTFADEAGRAVYLPHPDHKAFGSVLGPYLDKVLVVDYWTEQ
jgi:Stress responsive A/B Barrel Domain